jgi:HD-GYP domain-containing protein (c-di-GMP phosphodiesterase class II)
MRIRLTVVTGNREGETFYVGEGEQLTVGRDESADLQLIDPGVSRVHASVRLSEERPAVTDLGSSNGTLVNGNRITTVELEDGDMIQTGAVRLLVTLEEVGEIAEDPELAADELVVELDRSPFDFSQVQVRKRYDTEHEGLFMSGHGKLLDQYKIAHKSLETLYRISNLVHQEEDIDRLFEAIMDAVFNVFTADRILLIMRDRDFGSVEPVVFRKRGDAAAESRISISHTIVSEVLDNGISLLTFDAQKDERFKAGESVVMGGIRSVMCVPVQTGKEILGVVYLDTIGHPGEFSENDLELLSAIGKQAGIAIRRARLLDDLVEGYYSTVRTLVAAVEAKDSYTRGHSERVTAYAMTLGQILGLAEERLDILRLSSLLHDIGKIGVPESVLNKPGKLTEDEWLVIKRHPEVGATIVKNIKGQDIDLIAAVIRHHHEHFDGHGYPDGLSGENIPMLARVLAVADSYDAMTSKRSYRGSLSKQQVVTELSQGRGTQFDSTVAAAMLELVESGQVAPIEGNDTTVTL